MLVKPSCRFGPDGFPRCGLLGSRGWFLSQLLPLCAVREVGLGVEEGNTLKRNHSQAHREIEHHFPARRTVIVPIHDTMAHIPHGTHGTRYSTSDCERVIILTAVPGCASSSGGLDNLCSTSPPPIALLST